MPSLLASAIALIFAWAALVKAVRFGVWSAALDGYDLPTPLRSVVRVAAPALEATAAVLLLTGAARAGAILALVLSLAFCAATLRARSRLGRRLPCGCFGGRAAHDFRLLLGLDLGLAAASAVVAASGHAAAPHRLDASALPPVILAATGIGLAAWVIRQVTIAVRR